jgi:hypothetical protein
MGNVFRGSNRKLRLSLNLHAILRGDGTFHNSGLQYPSPDTQISAGKRVDSSNLQSPKAGMKLTVRLYSGMFKFASINAEMKNWRPSLYPGTFPLQG